MNPVQRAARTRQRRFGVLCVLAYVALAWAVRFDMPEGKRIASLVYPLDTFSMYAEIASEEMSYLLVRDGAGDVHQVTEFGSFDCPDPLSLDLERCSDGRPIGYLYDDLVRYVRRHRGPATGEAELILRTWRIRRGTAAVHASDCVIARCRVSR